MLEDWVASQYLPFQHELLCHDVFVPDALEVSLIEDGDLALHLGQEPRLDRVEDVDAVSQEVHDAAALELGVGLGQVGALLVTLHLHGAADYHVNLVGLKEEDAVFFEHAQGHLVHELADAREAEALEEARSAQQTAHGQDFAVVPLGVQVGPRRPVLALDVGLRQETPIPVNLVLVDDVHELLDELLQLPPVTLVWHYDHREYPVTILRALLGVEVPLDCHVVFLGALVLARDAIANGTQVPKIKLVHHFAHFDVLVRQDHDGLGKLFNGLTRLAVLQVAESGAVVRVKQGLVVGVRLNDHIEPLDGQLESLLGLVDARQVVHDVGRDSLHKPQRLAVAIDSRVELGTVTVHMIVALEVPELFLVELELLVSQRLGRSDVLGF